MNIYTIYDKNNLIEKGIMLDKINNDEIVYFSSFSKGKEILKKYKIDL